MGITLDADNADELVAMLRRINISVPARGMGRTKDDVEYSLGYRIISSLALNDKLAFPLSIRKGDRPDFSANIGGIDVGIEITEAVNERYAQTLAFAEQNYDE
jgi:hypothetical protein